jgi:DNA-directed RNA polymerase subunit alpha
MGIKYGKFELPAKIRVEDLGRGPNCARFVAEPLERGFGHTLGNSLRRIMLTSLEAPAIISVKIEGVPHEYMAVEGVIEDMTHIVLNLKNSLLRKAPVEGESDTRRVKTLSKHVEITPQMIQDAGGQYIVTLNDLITSSEFEVVNPEMRVFAVTKPFIRKVDFKVAVGRGYVASERQYLIEKTPDEIIIDACYSPVRLVNYYVENTRVGRDTDFDRLILDVYTDGRVSPQEALTYSTQIGILHFSVFDELKFQTISFDADEADMSSDRDTMMNKLALRINEIELSVRSTNCLSQANIDTIAELVIMPESDMLKFRNFGKKSLNEIKAKLEEMGLHLGMDLSRYGLTPENVKTAIQDYIAQKTGKEA